ncbi:unnamed protein product [Ceratitis capitata]|uniref:(Mediterranean fruit fly) hypothetical protein n=1 Tax=Ceratitis capitata TaxID=7213 RepID=A0A811VE57_CERCA|nr:unnamed protein product [Ceratitis capitata]
MQEPVAGSYAATTSQFSSSSGGRDSNSNSRPHHRRQVGNEHSLRFSQTTAAKKKESDQPKSIRTHAKLKENSFLIPFVPHRSNASTRQAKSTMRPVSSSPVFVFLLVNEMKTNDVRWRHSPRSLTNIYLPVCDAHLISYIPKYSHVLTGTGTNYPLQPAQCHHRCGQCFIEVVVGVSLLISVRCRVAI